MPIPSGWGGTAPTGRRSRLRAPITAALLSFLLPGLGQAAAGAYRRAAIVVIPAATLFVAVVVMLRGGALSITRFAVSPDALLAVALLDLVAFVYHVWAILDAYRLASRRRTALPVGIAARLPAGGRIEVRRAVPERPGPRSGLRVSPRSYVSTGSAWSPEPRPEPAPARRPARPARRSALASPWVGRAAAVLLILATAGIHARIASVDLAANDLLTSFTDPNGPSWLQPIPTDTPAPTVLASHLPGATPEPTPTPSPTPAPTATPNWMADGKLNLLVIGSDAGPDRWMLRTDTMIVATVDLATRRAALYGIPRNIENVPLPAETAGLFACRCYPDMLNSLYVYAAGHPAQFPGGNTRGFRALEGAIGTLLGVKVDGSVVVSLNGFVKLIDALGGLDMYVTERVVDSHYPKPDGSGNIAIDIEPGQHHFNGITALEYARSRHQDSDYGRMRRQQQVLLALRKDINPCSLLPRAEEIMGALKDTLWTDMPVAALPDLLGLAAHVNPATVASYEFVPPVYPEYLDAASIAKIRSVVSHGLDKVPTPTDTGGGGGGSGFSC